MFQRLRKDACYIIAEIGGNFSDFPTARRLIDEAAACGVDCVKLQTYRAETLTSRKAMFDFENTGIVSQFEIFRKYEIDEELHIQVFEYAKSQGLDCFSTPSHQTDVDMLDRIGMEAFKIGSDDATNLPFLRYVAALGKPILLSTGMCTLAEVHEVVDIIFSSNNTELYLFHTVSRYPTKPQDANIEAMRTLQREFPEIPVGYSDHTLGITAAVCAAAMGAAMVEKHFTYDKKAPGPDHMHSADPREMKAIVDHIRLFETMRGTGLKEPCPEEVGSRHNTRKSLTLLCPVVAGQRLQAEDLGIRRPGHGIPPKFLEQVLGRAVRDALDADHTLRWEDLT